MGFSCRCRGVSDLNFYAILSAVPLPNFPDVCWKTHFRPTHRPDPPEQFHRCVRRYHGDYKVKTFSCWNPVSVHGFWPTDLSGKPSAMWKPVCASRHDQLYHLGIRGKFPAASWPTPTVSANWRIYHDLAQLLIRRARGLYAQESIAAELNETVYALDSTTIDLCLSVFPWPVSAEPKPRSNFTRCWICVAPSHFHLDFTGQTSRCPRAGRVDSGGGSLLCDGSRRRGFPTALRLCPGRRLFLSPVPKPISNSTVWNRAGGLFDGCAQ